MSEEKKHALLSASTAHRWLTCTPSARLEQAEGIEECSVYAEEGTAAHELAEIKLSFYFGKIDDNIYYRRYEEFIEKYGKYYNKEFEEYVDKYVEYVISQTKGLKDFHILLETKVSYANIAPQGSGTADVLIITEDTVHVIDLKFGVGVPVNAIENPQLRLYGVGALNLFPNSKTVKMTINQPRLDYVDTEVLDKMTLLKWAIEFVKPRAEMAIKGEGVLQSSEKACKFCKLRGKCKERANTQLALAQEEFLIVDDRQKMIESLSEEQISNILETAPVFMDWFKDVQAYAFGQAMQGVKIPGFKLVEGKSNRIITDTKKVKEILMSMGFTEDDLMKPREMQGISNLERLVGKKVFAEVCKEYLVKPQGKLTLAPESDRRPEVNTLALAQSDFAEPIEEDK